MALVNDVFGVEYVSFISEVVGPTEEIKRAVEK